MKKQLLLLITCLLLIAVNVMATCSVSICSQTNVLCFGGCTGSLVACASGGTPPFTYSWSPSGGFGATASSLCAGTYAVYVSDGVGCITSATATITQPPILQMAGCPPVNVTCNGYSNGCAYACVTGGTPPYIFMWSPSGGTGATACGLAAGSYACTVSDGNGCTQVQMFTITQPPAITVVLGVTNVTCFGQNNGRVIATVNGGTPAYTYSWSPSGGTVATATNLAAGYYTVTVSDMNGCTHVSIASVTQPNPISINIGPPTNVSCANGNNGMLYVSPNGGTPPYTYSWSPSGQTGQTASNLIAGTYTIVVTDSHGCSATATSTLTQPTVLTAACFSTPVSCMGGNNGTASVIPGGGSPPYSYQWSPGGGTGQTATGLIANNYTVTVTDSHGCTRTSTTTVTQPQLLYINHTSGHTSCPTCCDGITVATPTGGTPGYTYSWSPGGLTTQTATNLCAGIYYCLVADSRGCIATATDTVYCNTPSVQASNITFTNITSNSATVHWTNGNGSRRIVLIRPTTPFFPPYDGQNYTANSTYVGSGQQVVYSGTGNSVTVTGLSSNSYYWFKVFEANCNSPTSAYNITSVLANPKRLFMQSSQNPGRPVTRDEGEEPASMSVIPNPAHGIFTVTFSGQWTVDSGQLYIYDMIGRCVYSQIINHKSEIINTFSAGIYFVKVQGGADVFTQKLIIE